MTTCQSRSAWRAGSASAGEATGSMSGWLELFQFPLESQKLSWSFTATLMWYALGYTQAAASGSMRESAQACVRPSARCSRSAATVVSSVWSAVGFFAGWSMTRSRVLPDVASWTVSRTWAEVKS